MKADNEDVLGQATMESVAEALDEIFNEGDRDIKFVVVAFDHEAGPKGCAIIGNYGDRETLLSTFRVLAGRMEDGADGHHA